MASTKRRVKLGPDTDLVALLEEVRSDRDPRVIEKDGKLIAAIVPVEDLERLMEARPSREGIDRALKAAGAWRDFDADALKEVVYRARHESPPSRQVSL